MEECRSSYRTRSAARTAALRPRPDHDPGRTTRQEALEGLQREQELIIQDVPEWLRSERGFFLFIRDHRLKPVPEAVALWGGILQARIALLESILARKDILESMLDDGLPLLEAFVADVGDATDLDQVTSRPGLDPRLRKLLTLFQQASQSHD